MSLDHIPEMSEIPADYLRLWEEHNRGPVDDSLWNQVISLALEEEQTERGKRGIYGAVPLTDLEALAKRVRGEPKSVDRYRMLAESGPNGKIWFDILSGLTSEEVVGSLGEEIGTHMWQRGLEIGTGTGALTRVINPHCNSLVSVDQAHFLQEIAKSRVKSNAQFLTADAYQLPFALNSFDLAVSSGLTSAMSSGDLGNLAQELSRVIKPGGFYFDAFLLPPGKDELHISDRKSLSSAKGILADMIVDAVSGKSRIEEKKQFKGIQDFKDIFTRNCFDMGGNVDQKRGVLTLAFRKRL